MKKTLTTIVLVAGSLVALGFASLRQLQPSQPNPAPPSTPASAPQPGAIDKKQLAAMMAMKGQPAAEHQVLDALTGTFDVEFKLTMMPGTPPIVSNAVATSQWVLGKRFVQSTMLPAAAEELKMESINYYGYDKRTKKYFLWGIDSSDTYSIFAEGDYDATTKTFTFTGENLEEGIGNMTFRFVTTLDRPDGFTQRLFFQLPEAARGQAPAGVLDKDGWFTVVTMTATRRK